MRKKKHQSIAIPKINTEISKPLNKIYPMYVSFLIFSKEQKGNFIEETRKVLPLKIISQKNLLIELIKKNG